MIRPLLAALSLLIATLPARAEAPRVATDILPVQSLVAMVMKGVGSPDLIVSPGASPHGYSLRPSEARALEDADLVFWMGPALTPWLEEAIGTLARDAHVTSLLRVDATVLHLFREGVGLESHHGHDDHSHTGVDPHAWLDPQNAIAWIEVIAFRLAQEDPDNAATYAKNAKAAQAEIETVSAQITAKLAPLHDRPYIVFHDAYQYFEHRFDIPAAGSITLSDATKPSPARLAEIRGIIAETGARCVFSEVQFNPALIATVMEGSDAHTTVLDPLGTEQTPGPGLYLAVLQAMADQMAGCL